MSDSARRLYVPLFIVTALVASAIPTTYATFNTYGDRVGEAASETDMAGLLLVNLASAVLRYDDRDSSSTPNTGDRFYLIVDGSGPVGSTDVRLATISSLTGGKQVTSSDSDHGATVISTALGSWAYDDTFTGTGATGVFNLGEGLYLDVNNDLEVSAGDIRVITESSSRTTGGTASWAQVASTDTKDGRTLTAISGHQYAVLDMNGDGVYGVDDVVVLDTDANNRLGPNDVYLTAGASGVTAGTTPKIGDRLTFHYLTALGSAVFAFDDDASVGVIDDTEQIYIDVDGSGTVTVNDIRIGPVSGSASTSSNAGKQVITGDTDLTNALTTQGTLRYRDINGNAVFDAKDDLYLDIGGSSTTEIEAGDLRMAAGTSGKTPGARVKSTDTTEVGKNFAGALSTGALHFLDYDGGNVYALNDIVYWDVDDDNVLTPGDVRLSIGPSPVSTFGKYLIRSNTDAESCYRFTFASAELGYVDESNPGSVQIEEGVYLDRAGDDEVSTNDIRISGATTTLKAGEFVQSGDADRGSTLTELASLPFRYYDANGDARYSLGIGTASDDVVYVNTNGDSIVSVGDVRVSKSGSLTAGSKVKAGESDEGKTLTALPATFTIRGYDVDGDATFTKADSLYINVDHTTRPSGAITDASLITRGCVTNGDVQISGTGGAAGTVESTATSTPVATPTATNAAPVASVTCTATVGARTVTMSGSGSSDSDGSISSYSWNMGDGNTATGVSVTHTFAADGQYAVRLTVTDNKGDSRSSTYTVTIPIERSDCKAVPIETPAPTTPTSPAPTESPAATTPVETPPVSPTPTGGTPKDTGGEGEPTPGPAMVVALLAIIGLIIVARRR